MIVFKILSTSIDATNVFWYTIDIFMKNIINM